MLLYQILTCLCFILCIVYCIKARKEFTITRRVMLLDSSYSFFWSGIIFLNCIVLLYII